MLIEISNLIIIILKMIMKIIIMTISNGQNNDRKYE